MDKNNSFKVGAPGSNPVQMLLFLFSFYLLPQVLGQSNLNGGLYFIWNKLRVKDKPLFEEDRVDQFTLVLGYGAYLAPIPLCVQNRELAFETFTL